MMTPENQKRHDEKLKRINDAIALKEPDKVPLTPHPGLYPIFHAGYTVAETIYDTSLDKMKDAVVKYLNDFDPDAGHDIGQIHAGEGPALEMMQAKNQRWAGMPGNIIDENSFHQHIEYPFLLEDEFDEFFTDRTGWILRKSLPRTSTLFEPFAGFRSAVSGTRQMAALLSTPEYRAMIQQMWAIDDFYKAHQQKAAAFKEEVKNMGFPMLRGMLTGAGNPFDSYSNSLRGTLLAMTDLYDRPEVIQRYLDEQIEVSLDRIRESKGRDMGKHVFMPLHKGIDGFLSDEHYRKYYWKYLQQIIVAITETGQIPYVYTEGKYNTRLDYLADVPPGKVFYHFEEVDMAVAKKKLGGVACISGSFPSALLDWSTPDKVREEVKRLIDTCAPGGGYIFETSCGLGNCKRENVEAMFETVREFGVY